MPTVTVTADILDPKDVLVAAMFLKTVAEGGIEAGFERPEEQRVVDHTTAFPPAAATEEPKKTRKPKASEDIVVYLADGSKKAVYTHSKDAADIFVAVWETATTSAELKALQEANLQSMARLAKEDLDRIAPAIAKHSELVKKREAEAAAPKPEADLSELDAMMNGTEPPKPMTAEDFGKAMFELVRSAGPQEAGAWLKKQGFEAVSQVPENARLGIVNAAKDHIAYLHTKFQ